jgi:putative DNA primase/helicase
LGDRDQDNWEPLIAIAACAGPLWVDRAVKAALAMSNTAESPVSTGNELLADIQTVFEQKRTFKIKTVELIEALVKDETNAWATYNRGKAITPGQPAKMLSAYGIRSKTVRNGLDTPKGYDADQFTDAFQRYLKAPESATPEKLLQRRNGQPDLTGDATDIADAAARAAEIQLLMDDIDPPDRGAVADTLQVVPADRSLDF